MIIKGRFFSRETYVMGILILVFMDNWLKYATDLFFQAIMQTCPCNVHPLKPHFYIEKLGFTRV